MPDGVVQGPMAFGPAHPPVYLLLCAGQLPGPAQGAHRGHTLPHHAGGRWWQRRWGAMPVWMLLGVWEMGIAQIVSASTADSIAEPGGAYSVVWCGVVILPALMYVGNCLCDG